MHKRVMIVVIWVVLLLAACGGDGGEGETAVSGPEATSNALATAIVASSEPPIDPATLSQEIDEAEALWNSHEITAYSVEIRHRRPTWSTQVIELTVENGEVVDVNHTCFPQQDCILQEVDPQTLTVENLFEVARNVVSLQDPETEMTFNPTYGYPNAVSYEDASWVTNSFEVLAP